MVHDYHLYTLPGDGPRGAPGRLPAPLRPHPVDPAGRLARAADARSATQIYHGLLANDIIGFHTRSYQRNFLQCCRDLHGPRGRLRGRHRARATGARCGCAHYPLPIDYEATRGVARRPRVREFEERVLAPPARVRDPARGPRGPVEERPARVHRVRHLPRAAPGVRRADHVHRAADAVADRRARVRRVPGEDRGAGRGRQPPPRHARLDADRPQAARRPRRGRRLLQALRRDDGQRDVRRHEPRRQGRAAGQRAPRRLDPAARTPAPTRSSASSRSP